MTAISILFELFKSEDDLNNKKESFKYDYDAYLTWTVKCMNCKLYISHETGCIYYIVQENKKHVCGKAY